MVYKILKPKETGIISRLLGERRISIEEAAKRLSVTPRTIKRALEGQTGINPRSATELYSLLQRDPQVAFLTDYGAIPNYGMSDIERAWEGVIDVYATRIKRLIKEKPEERDKIIGALEMLSNEDLSAK